MVNFRFSATALAAGLLAGVLVAIPWNLASAAGARAKISTRDCKRLVGHKARPDVAYRPGVDVRGRKVKPTDLAGAPPLKLPREMSFNIGIDLAEKYGIGAGGKFEGKGNVGKVTMRGGRAYFNGQPLGSSANADLVRRCNNLLGGKR